MNETATSRVTEQSGNIPEIDPFAGFPPARTLRLTQGTKIVILLILAAGAILYLYLKFVPAGGSQSTPRNTVENFFRAAIAKDAKEMVSYLSFVSEGTTTIDVAAKETFIRDWEKAFEDNPETTIFEDYEIIDVHEEKDTASVDAKVKLTGLEEPQEAPYMLIKIEDKWFIDIFGQ